MTIETFEAFGFAEPLNRALTQCGYVAPTPIQVQALPPQLSGRDLLGMAETGSGKTATFVLPILQKLAAHPVEPAPKQVSVLILAPTRELAIQIDQEVASLSRNMRIRRAVVLGGVSKGPQINALKRGVHVLVATPGRLLDLINMRTCDLSAVDTFVLDEADRMFDMGFIRDIKKIVALIPKKRRTALFSATMPDEIRKFAYDVLHEPYRVDLSTKTMVVDRIDQKVMIVRTPEKQSRLHTILADPGCSRVIVFTRTKRGADRVADRLAMSGITASAFHGNKAQNARQRALNDFTMGQVRVLVATDIAARGIDVSNITHVVNFDMPLDPETYVHRVGRTARKGNSGIAISLCDPSERQEIQAIERLMKQKIEVIGDVGGETLPQPARRSHRGGDGARREGGQRASGIKRGDREHRHHASSDRQESRDDRTRGEQSHVTGTTNGDRRRHARADDAGHRDPQHANQPNHGERRPHSHRASDRHPGEHRRIDHSADHRRPGRHAGHADGQHSDRSRSGAAANHQSSNAPTNPQHERGDSRRGWSSADTPKFMKRRDDGRGGPRPGRNPAS